MRVLLVSIALPPKNDPEALQTAKYLKYLSKEVSVDVVTSKSPTLWMPYDIKLRSYSKYVKQRIEIKIFEPKYLSIFINKLFRRFAKPDTRLTFHLQSKKVIKQLKNKPDIIYSRAFPLSSIIMAKKLKKHYNVPWLLHLSDPWVESPLFDYDKSSYHQKEEKECFKLADIISFTSLKTMDIYSAKYPEFKEKYEFFPNVYDDEDIIETSPKKNIEKLKIVYTGSLNGTRSLKLFGDAISKMEKDNNLLLNKFEIIVAGSVDSQNSNFLKKHSKYITHCGFLSIVDVKALQRSADLLIAVDFNFEKPEEAIYFPSKLLDYFITKKPILGITTKGSALEEILNKSNHNVVYHNEVDDLIIFLECFCKSINQNYSIPKDYSSSLNVNRLINLFEKICRK